MKPVTIAGANANNPFEDRIRNLIRDCHTPDSIWYIGTRDMQKKLAKHKRGSLRVGICYCTQS